MLATGLSGLYSSLPTKIEVPSEEWHCLSKDDLLQMPSLIQFLNSLEFCNAVIQVNMCDDAAEPTRLCHIKNVFTHGEWLQLSA